MIREDEVFKIGKFGKPHGIKGEITLSFDNDIFDRKDCPYLIGKIDGILVPFFMTEYRFKGEDTALITLEDVDSEIQAKRFKGIEVYYPKIYLDENEPEILSLDYYIGFSVEDNNLGAIGEIVDVDDSTINTLFLIKNKEGQELIVPASDDFIINIDEENKLISLSLPEGLIDL